MLTATRWFLVSMTALMALVSGCGDRPETIIFEIPMPRVAAQGPCDETVFAPPNTVTATATVSGAADACTVAFDAADLSASGSCSIEYAEVVRFLAFEYTLTDSTSTTADLSAVIAILDLRPETIGNTREISIDLRDPAPPQADVVATPSQYADLPTNRADCDDTPEELTPDEETADYFLCEAKRWWVGRQSGAVPDYDLDDNGVSNVDEACAGTLFD